jgi:hypothetical protein
MILKESSYVILKILQAKQSDSFCDLTRKATANTPGLVIRMCIWSSEYWKLSSIYGCQA